MKDYTLSTKIIIEEAKKRGIEVEDVFPGKLAVLKYGDKVEYIFNQFISKTNAVAYKICHHKEVALTMLAKDGLSIPRGKNFNTKSYSEALAFFDSIKKPVVLKPTDSTHGDSVFMNINNENELKKAWFKISKKHKNILIEEFFKGTEYRIFATGEKVLGVTHRIPANVDGDGMHSIKELIRIKNKNPNRGSGYQSSLLKIKIDGIIKNFLDQQGLNLDYVPTKGERIFLRSNSNLSTGGDSIDYTDKIHSSVGKIATKAIRSIPGLAYGGIDLLAEDITKEQTKDSYAIIEINASPMISMHHFPYEGKSRNVAKEIIDLAFPETKSKAN